MYKLITVYGYAINGLWLKSSDLKSDWEQDVWLSQNSDYFCDILGIISNYDKLYMIHWTTLFSGILWALSPLNNTECSMRCRCWSNNNHNVCIKWSEIMSVLSTNSDYCFNQPFNKQIVNTPNKSSGFVTIIVRHSDYLIHKLWLCFRNSDYVLVALGILRTVQNAWAYRWLRGNL